MQNHIGVDTHVGGAIHVGMAKGEYDRMLQELSGTVFIGGLPAGMKILRGLAAITLKGLTPLREIILKETSA